MFNITISWKFCLITIILLFIIIWALLGNNENRKIKPTYPSDVFGTNDLFNITEDPAPPCVQENVVRRTGRSNSENMAAEVFTQLIQEYGGESKNVKYNVRLPELINPETGRRLELDVYYNDGYRKIGLEYDGQHHSTFPSHIHANTPKGRTDFEALVRRDRYKDECCLRNNIYLIRVPHTVDTCDVDINGEYKYNPRIRKEDRKYRLVMFIREKLDNYLNMNR